MPWCEPETLQQLQSAPCSTAPLGLVGTAMLALCPPPPGTSDLQPTSSGAWEFGGHRNGFEHHCRPCALLSSLWQTQQNLIVPLHRAPGTNLSLLYLKQDVHWWFHCSTPFSMCAFALPSRFPICTPFFLSVQQTQVTPSRSSISLALPLHPLSTRKAAVIYLLVLVSRWHLDSRLSPLRMW